MKEMELRRIICDCWSFCEIFGNDTIKVIEVRV